MLLLTLNANTLAREFHLRRASSFFSLPFPLTVVFRFFFCICRAEELMLVRPPGSRVNLREMIRAGYLQDASSSQRGANVLVQFFSSSCIGCIYLPSTPLHCLLWQSAPTSRPAPALPSLSSTFSPPTLRTVLLSRGCRCTQFNFAVPLRRRKRAEEGWGGWRGAGMSE